MPTRWHVFQLSTPLVSKGAAHICSVCCSLDVQHNGHVHHPHSYLVLLRLACGKLSVSSWLFLIANIHTGITLLLLVDAKPDCASVS